MNYLIVHDDCRARWNNDFVGRDSVESSLIDYIAVAHDSVGRLGHFHCALLVIAVKNNDDIVPSVAHLFQILETINHQTIAARQELQVLAH